MLQDDFSVCNGDIFVSQGFLSTACLAMVSLVQVAQCQDPAVNLELLLSDAQVRSGQQQPNIEQLLSAARVQEGGQQLGPGGSNAPLAAQIPVVKSNVIPDTIGQDDNAAGEVRKFRPRLLRQRLRQTLTNLKNRESIIPLPSTVAPQDVTQTTPTPRQVKIYRENIVNIE